MVGKASNTNMNALEHDVHVHDWQYTIEVLKKNIPSEFNVNHIPPMRRCKSCRKMEYFLDGSWHLYEISSCDHFHDGKCDIKYCYEIYNTNCECPMQRDWLIIHGKWRNHDNGRNNSI